MDFGRKSIFWSKRPDGDQKTKWKIGDQRPSQKTRMFKSGLVKDQDIKFTYTHLNELLSMLDNTVKLF